MAQTFHISKWVRIRPGCIDLDGERVFDSEEHGDAFLNAAYRQLQLKHPRFFKMDAMSKCGFIAAHLLLKETGTDDIDPFRKGMIFQNHSASLDTDRKFQHSIREIASPALFVYTLPNIVMGEIAIQFRCKGENTFFVSEQFDAQPLHQYTEILLEQEILQLALTGYIEYLDAQPDILLCLVQQEGKWPFTTDQLNVFYQDSLAPKRN